MRLQDNDKKSVLDVYFAQIPKVCDLETVVPLPRKEEVASCGSEAVKRQKYAVWKLLIYGLQRSFGFPVEELLFTKNANGKWGCGACEFSLSHSKNAVAVALSNKPVGIDLELKNSVKTEALERKILTEKERSVFSSLAQGRIEFLSRKWTEKESLFKKSGGMFRPQEIDPEGQPLKTVTVTVAGEDYFLTVASDEIGKFQIFPQVEIT